MPHMVLNQTVFFICALLVHADYQGKVAVYSIIDGALLAGELPPNKHKLVVAWIEIHHEDLFADWNLAVNGKKPFSIKGLDQ
jgi:hypothetical protein